MKSFVRALAFVLVIAAPFQVARAADPAKFIDKFANEAIALASDQEITATERRDRFGVLLNTYFDMPAIGRFLLGRHWRATSEDEREAYLQAFTDNITYTYARRFDDYTGQELVVDEARQDGRFQLVTSRIIDPSKNQELRLDWRVAEGESGLKIIDVVIEGVSMSITQRQEYASVIQNNGGKVQALIDALNKQMAALK
jgi:phospholipid transport system substrate-binding protein